jgi:hypothetical protein
VGLYHGFMKTETVLRRSEPVCVVPAWAETALQRAATGYDGWHVAVALMKRL